MIRSKRGEGRGSDEDSDDKKRGASSSNNSVRKSGNSPETKDDAKNDSDSDSKPKSGTKRKLGTNESSSTSAAHVRAIDPTTLEGQLAVNPGMNNDEAREAAKKEYHRKHAARSRVRHRGLLKDLQEKVSELRTVNDELKATHMQLLSQLHASQAYVARIYPSASQAASLPINAHFGSIHGSAPVATMESSTRRPLLSDLLQGGMPFPIHQNSFLTSQSQLAGLNSLIQTQVLASQPRQGQSDAPSLQQSMLRTGPNDLLLDSPSQLHVNAASNSNSVSRLLAEAIQDQPIFQLHVQAQSSAFPASGSDDIILRQLRQHLQQNSEVQLAALLGLHPIQQQQSQPQPQWPLVQIPSLPQQGLVPSSASVPTADDRRQQELVELIRQYLEQSSRR